MHRPRTSGSPGSTVGARLSGATRLSGTAHLRLARTDWTSIDRLTRHRSGRALWDAGTRRRRLPRRGSSLNASHQLGSRGNNRTSGGLARQWTLLLTRGLRLRLLRRGRCARLRARDGNALWRTRRSRTRSGRYGTRLAGRWSDRLLRIDSPAFARQRLTRPGYDLTGAVKRRIAGRSGRTRSRGTGRRGSRGSAGRCNGLRKTRSGRSRRNGRGRRLCGRGLRRCGRL